MNSFIKQGIWFVFIVLLQVGILSNINFLGFVNPFFYIYLIIILPFNSSKLKVLLIGFFLGLSIDMFLNTPGLHTFPTVFVAYIRPLIIRRSISKSELELIKNPTLFNLGLSSFGIYAVSMIFIHHFILYAMESFRWSGMLDTLLGAVYSSIMTLILVFLAQILFGNRDKTL